MSKLRLAALTLALLAPTSALAQSNAARAESLNEEGKKLFAAGREASDPAAARRFYERAHARFLDAIEASPEGRFYFNACFTLNFLERYQDAIEMCEQVESHGGDAALVDKTNKALVSLRQKLAAQGGGATDPGTGTGTDPGTGTGTGTDPGTGTGTGTGTDPGTGTGAGTGTGTGTAAGGGGFGGVQPAADDPFVATKAPGPEDTYKWSLGGELGGLSNGGMGKDGDVEMFAASGASLRLFANFMLSEERRFGVQTYLGIAALDAGDENAFDEGLTVADIGGALFKSFRLAPHLYLTPLAGAHLSIQQLETGSEGFVAVGGRLEASLAYVFGAKGEHALSAGVGVNLYGPASGSADGFEPADFNLDQGSATGGFGVGYTYRFSTPFGSGPLISLE